MAVNMGQAVGYLTLDAHGFTETLASAAAQLRTFSDQTTSIGGKFSALGNVLTGIGGQMTAKVTTPVLAAGAAAVASGSQFNAAMSQVAATMGKPVSAIQNLRQQAIKMGNDTVFSAKEAAEGLNYLALAGYSTDQQMAALPKTLALAQAGGMELGRASDMLTDSMSALGLASTDSKVLMKNMTTTVDQMAKTASKSNTSVEQLGDAILTVGGTAKGLSGFQKDAAHGTAELSTALGILADNSIKGAEGGTALRNIITLLNPSTKPAIEAFNQLGVSAYDSNGNMRPLKDTFGDLQTALSKYTQKEQEALKVQMFGRESLSAVNAMLGTSGERWDELTGQILKSNGAAEKMGKTMNDNLPGDLKMLESAIGTTSIIINDMVDGPLRKIVQGITGLVNAFNNADPAVQKLALTIGLIAAAVGPVLLILGQFASAIGAIITAGSQLSTIFAGVKTAIATAFSGGGATGIVGFLASLAQVSIVVGVIIAAVDAFRNAWDQNLNGIQENVQSIFSNIQTIFQGVSDVAIAVVTGIVDAWNNDFGGIRTTVETVISAIAAVIAGVLETVTTVASGIKQAWDDNFLGIQDIVTNVINTVETVIQGATDVINEVIDTVGPEVEKGLRTLETAANKLKQAWDKDFAGMRTIVTAAMDAIGGAIEVVTGIVQGVVKTVTALLSGDWKGAWEQAKTTVTTAKEKITTILENLSTAAKEAMPKLLTAIKEGFNKVVTEGPKVLNKLVTKAGEILQKVVEKAKKELPKFAEQVKKGASEAKDKFVEFLQKLPGKAGELLNKAVTKAQEFVNKFGPKAKQAASEFLTKLGEKLKEVPGKVGELLGKVVGKAIKFVAEFPAKAKEAATKFVNKLMGGTEDAPPKMGEIKDKIIEVIKDLPGQMLDIGKDIVQGLIDGITSMVSTAVQAAADFAGGFIKGMKDALGIHSPSKVAKKEVGENLANGVIEGVRGKKGAAKKSAEELAKEMVSAAKSGMSDYKEIYNLSAAEQAKYWAVIVKNTKEGTAANREAQAEYAKAIKASTSEALKAETDYVKRAQIVWDAKKATGKTTAKDEAEYWKKILDNLKKGSDNYLKVLKKYNQAVTNQQKEQEKKEKDYLTKRNKQWEAYAAEHGENAEKEAKFWEKTLKHLTKGTNTYLDAYKKYQKAVNAVSKEKWDNFQQEYEKQNQQHEMSLYEQQQYWQATIEAFEKGSEERLAAEKKYADAHKAYLDGMEQAEKEYMAGSVEISKQLTQDLKAVQQEYDNAVEQRQQAILSSFSLFEKYEQQSRVTGNELIKNIRSQVDALHEWDRQLDSLEQKKILPEGMIDEIRAMGVDATEQIRALNSMSSTELQTYADLWQEKMGLAKTQAESELMDMKTKMEIQQEEINLESQRKMEELRATYDAQLTELGANLESKGEQSAKGLQHGLQDGLRQEQGNTEKHLNALVKSVQSAVDKVRSMQKQLSEMASRASDYAENVKRSIREAQSFSQQAGISTKGSHKSGLDYVPHDGYVATLHKGERVLTEAENREYSSGANGTNIVNNFYGTKPLDERETARQFKLAQRQIALNW